MKKLIRYSRDLWLIAGLSLLLFVVLEVTCSLVLVVMDRYAPPDPRNPDVRANADAYKDVSWGEDYFEEFNESFDARWEPYVYWRRKPYGGKYITVDSSGRRVTPNSIKSPGRGFHVFAFGGSTMWGTGARDAFTIPALLAAELRQKGLNTEIVNYGESGFVSTQEVVTLLRLLQQGTIPDLVIFYDGINDTYSALQQGVAGLSQNEAHRVQEFNLTKRVSELQRIAARSVLDGLATVQISKRVLGIEATTVIPEFNGRVAEEAVDLYLRNMEFVKALSRFYGFKYYFCWQPTVFGKRQLSEYEKAEKEAQKDLEKFYSETYRILREKTAHIGGDGTFRNLSDIFLSEENPVYIDWMHVSEQGNEIIAQAMAENVSHILQSAVASER